MNSIRIATRASALALTQSDWIGQQLQKHHPNLKVELIKIKTKGDKILNQSLAKIGGKGLFIKELQQALFENKADIAVHSVKDLPYEQTQKLRLAAIGFRENPSDLLVFREATSLEALPKGAVIGTSSLRRQMQILRLRPDLVCKGLRGNVPTRCQKLMEGQFDAIILASAGVKRLKIELPRAYVLPVEDFVPAVGQGALGVECREDDDKIYNLIKPLHQPDVARTVLAERAMNRALKGSCSVPIAGFAYEKDNQLFLTGRVGTPDGKVLLEAKAHRNIHAPDELGLAVAEDLLAQGAQQIIDACAHE